MIIEVCVHGFDAVQAVIVLHVAINNTTALGLLVWITPMTRENDIFFVASQLRRLHLPLHLKYLCVQISRHAGVELIIVLLHGLNLLLASRQQLLLELRYGLHPPGAVNWHREHLDNLLVVMVLDDLLDLLNALLHRIVAHFVGAKIKWFTG